MQQPVGARISVEQRGQASVDSPVQPMPLPLRQANPNGLDHLMRNQVAITKPELVVIAQGQSPAHPGHRLLRLNQASLQLTGTATSDGCK